MPIIAVQQGDLLKKFKDREFDVIVQGCNCFHTMGAGIARQIARSYSEAIEADLETVRGDRSRLGSYSVARIWTGQTIINAYTQFFPGKEKPEVLYEAIETVFANLNDRTEFQREWTNVGIPFIGCGIAGGDWDVVKDIIDTVTPDLNIIAVEYVR